MSTSLPNRSNRRTRHPRTSARTRATAAQVHRPPSVWPRRRNAARRASAQRAAHCNRTTAVLMRRTRRALVTSSCSAARSFTAASRFLHHRWSVAAPSRRARSSSSSARARARARPSSDRSRAARRARSASRRDARSAAAARQARISSGAELSAGAGGGPGGGGGAPRRAIKTSNSGKSSADEAILGSRRRVACEPRQTCSSKGFECCSTGWTTR